MVDKGDAEMGTQAGLVLAAGFDMDDGKTLRGLRVNSEGFLCVCLYVWDPLEGPGGDWVKMTQP